MSNSNSSKQVLLSVIGVAIFCYGLWNCMEYSAIVGYCHKDCTWTREEICHKDEAWPFNRTLIGWQKIS